MLSTHDIMNGKINKDYLLKAAFEDFEVQPSPEMLNNILEGVFDASVESAFDGFISAPPPHIWESINESIPTEADKAFSTSFDEFKVTPPAHLWENISDSIPSEVDTLMNASFNEFEVTPPANMWASIQSELDVEEHFDTKFQEAFSGFAPTPSEHILSNVLSTKFDTGVRRAFMRHEVEPREAVWDRIKPYIRFSPVIQRHLPTVRRMAAVVLCLLLCTFLYKQIDISGVNTTVANTNKPSKINTITEHTSQIPTQNEAEQPSESVLEKASTERIVSVEKRPVTREATGQSGEIDQTISQSSSVGSGSSRVSNGSSLPPVSSGSDDAVLLSPTFTTASVTDENTDNLISSISNDKISGLETYAPDIIISNPDLSDFGLLEVTNALDGKGSDYAPNTVSNLMNMEEDNDLVKMMLNYKGWYVSSSLALYNSWILNDEVRENLSDQYQLDYEVSLGNSFGIGVGYQFTPSFGIEAEILSNRLSQRYTELTNLNAMNPGDAYASYLYVPLSFKYQTRRLNSLNRRVPITLSVVMGTHYGKFQSVEIGSPRDIEVAPDTEDRFIQQELGVFTGVDYHFYVNPNTHLTFGARAAAGTDFEYLSAPFAAGTPYNLQIGARIGLNYRFATRKYKWNNGIY